MQIERCAKVKIDVGMILRQRQYLGRHVDFGMTRGQQDSRYHGDLFAAGVNIGFYSGADGGAGKLQIAMGNDLIRCTLAHQRHQRFEFAYGIRIATAVTGNHNAEIRTTIDVRQGSVHRASGAGSIWLAMGMWVRINMMLMSLNSLSAHSARLPCHSASARVRFSQTSVG